MPRKKRRTIRKILKEIEKDYDKIEELEEKELKDLKRLEQLEEEIKKQTAPHPLTKITYRDFSKAAIGAIIGTVAHFAFIEGADIAVQISTARATWLLILSFLIGSVFIYLTGFRQVKQVKLAGLLPLRITVIYITSLFMILLILLTFGLTDLSSFNLLYKQVAVISILAVLGASTADLIGKGE